MRKFGRGKTVKVGDLFETYRKKLRAPEKTVIIECKEVVEELLNIKLHEADIRFNPSTKTLTILGGGPIRSEITIHKKELLAHLRARLGDGSAPKEIL